MKTIQKQVSILLTLIMVVSLFTIVPVFADAVDAAKTYYYTLDEDGNATLVTILDVTVIQSEPKICRNA